MALRFAVYGDAPIQERQLEAVAAKFGIDRPTLWKAWQEDGIEAAQAKVMGIMPLVAEQRRLSCVAMGSREAGKAEARAREGQLDLLRTRRSIITSSLDSLPARIQHLNSLPLDPAVSLAIDSANREASKLVTELRTLNAMIAEATGLDVIQSLSLAAAKAQALKPQAPKDQERETRGVVVEL